MYIPATFAENDPAMLMDLIRQHPLGMLITAGASGLQASPVPFLCRRDGEKLTLVAHLARANAHWKDLVGLQECLVVFQGPASYVSPDWYPSKTTTHKVVPTWNYAMVQARGVPKLLHAPDWLREQVGDLTDAMERSRATPWAVSDAPDDFIASQLKAIVGIEIDVVEIRGKWKMSQNRTPEDAGGVARALADPSEPHANPVVADIVAARMPRKP